MAAFNVGDNVDKKNENIVIAKVNGMNNATAMYKKLVSVKKPKPNINPARYDANPVTIE